ncbi:hypothetical protein BKP37_13965 [Anaerobacillus alkalilacustris]|uniref:Uncharacterized protein n=1 Tax=Anaerobacillus alkalilacustris TaxID=393763 RepID=A0A1S2LJ27_9BACI|nr:hypothetical protein [Anaerobacillus alkalilacustris]OIJ12529.1 hypothetical protein BKP37_13965 [Anaerobacillus alkalilacustris]
MKNKYNKYPFLFLLIIHTSLLIYTIYKKKPKEKIIVLLLSNIGLAYFFEYIVFNIFNSYCYKPKIFKNTHFDNIAGAILSQAIFVPFTAVFITIFELGWKTKILFSCYFFGIEHLFIRLGLFKPYWWRTIYTLISIPIYFKISDIWYKNIQRPSQVVSFISLFLMLIVTNSNFLFVLALIKQIKFRLGHSRSWRTHFILAPLYSIMCGCLNSFSAMKNRWYYHLSVIITCSAADWLLNRFRFVKVKFPLGFLNIGYHFLLILLANTFKKRLLNEQS